MTKYTWDCRPGGVAGGTEISHLPPRGQDIQLRLSLAPSRLALLVSDSGEDRSIYGGIELVS